MCIRGNSRGNAVWIYEAPYAAVTEINDHDAFYLVRADWIEEQHARPCAEVEAPIGHSADRAIDPVLILGTPLAAAPYRASGFVPWPKADVIGIHPDGSYQGISCRQWDGVRRLKMAHKRRTGTQARSHSVRHSRPATFLWRVLCWLLRDGEPDLD